MVGISNQSVPEMAIDLIFRTSPRQDAFQSFPMLWRRKIHHLIIPAFPVSSFGVAI